MITVGVVHHVNPRFLIDPFEPAHLAADRSGAVAERVAAGLRELEDCCACPRNCRVNRMANETRVATPAATRRSPAPPPTSARGTDCAAPTDRGLVVPLRASVRHTHGTSLIFKT
jgi:hypothetical protein